MTRTAEDVLSGLDRLLEPLCEAERRRFHRLYNACILPRLGLESRRERAERRNMAVARLLAEKPRPTATLEDWRNILEALEKVEPALVTNRDGQLITPTWLRTSYRRWKKPALPSLPSAA